MAKISLRVSGKSASQAISYASHSLVTEGFHVTAETKRIVHSVLTGETSEHQFHLAVKRKFNV
ncbi:hypothetical protein [Planomicrobium sp. YIM 101495]|uniref:hypothetical protein n=1 Tax=Planomicrobium sp. YIM 101495 TaxID=2665160 RepID=UPI0012B93260|nr:hypothetical protein [Planomicrobium sp. YIM 101495]MTD31064.1 hypothetical protein [Planomicrobium sp. YIM 101495]